MEISLGRILLPDPRSLNVPGEALVLPSLFLPEWPISWTREYHSLLPSKPPLLGMQYPSVNHPEMEIPFLSASLTKNKAMGSSSCFLPNENRVGISLMRSRMEVHLA